MSASKISNCIYQLIALTGGSQCAAHTSLYLRTHCSLQRAWLSLTWGLWIYLFWHQVCDTLHIVERSLILVAIHSQIFQYRSSVSSFQNLTPISNTLRNWRAVWDVFAATSASGESPHITVDMDFLRPDNAWKRIGFCRHCPEYWLLAKLMADRLSLLGSIAKEDEQVLLDDGPTDPILRSYDQTSMRQVNDLILGFQTFQL